MLVYLRLEEIQKRPAADQHLLEEALKVAKVPQSSTRRRGTTSDGAYSPKDTAFGRLCCCSVSSKSYIRRWREESGKYESIFKATGRLHKEKFQKAWAVADRPGLTEDEYKIMCGLVELGRQLPGEVPDTTEEKTNKN